MPYPPREFAAVRLPLPKRSRCRRAFCRGCVGYKCVPSGNHEATVTPWRCSTPLERVATFLRRSLSVSGAPLHIGYTRYFPSGRLPPRSPRFPRIGCGLALFRLPRHAGAPQVPAAAMSTPATTTAAGNLFLCRAGSPATIAVSNSLVQRRDWTRLRRSGRGSGWFIGVAVPAPSAKRPRTTRRYSLGRPRPPESGLQPHRSVTCPTHAGSAACGLSPALLIFLQLRRELRLSVPRGSVLIQNRFVIADDFLEMPGAPWPFRTAPIRTRTGPYAHLVLRPALALVT